MKKIKQFIKNNFKHLSYFYKHLGYKVFVSFLLSLLVGVLDGFGLTMFFPLLEMVDGKPTDNSGGLGGLTFLIDGIEALGISLNIYSVLVIITVFFLLKGIMKFFEQFYNVTTRQYFVRKLRYENVNKFANYKYEAFVLSDNGRIQNTLTGEVEKVSQAYRNYFMAIQSGVLVFVYIVFAIITNAQFALLVVIGGGLSNLLYKQVYIKTKETSRKITRGGHVFQGLLIQKVAFFKYLKATNQIRKYSQKLRLAIDDIVKSEIRIGFFNSLLAAAREPIVIIVIVAVIMFQVSFFSADMGVIVLSLLFFYRSLTSLVSMQNYWNQYLNVSGALENMQSFMLELSIEQEKHGKHKVDSLNNSINLHNVGFSYSNSPVLTNISLKINKNETVAFVGESGSGKTTLVNLISGLLTPMGGEIYLDDIPYKEIDVSTLQNKIGYITQEPVIFNDTVFNNITFWAEDTPENKERFWKALNSASIDTFVKNLHKREDSSLGHSGVLVSGGQKQRLSIARELYKNDIEILIMDEATSALDSENEFIIQQNLALLKGRYTILVVAHRLSTIKDADKIVLVDKGAVVEVGTFNELIKSSPRFREMALLQEV